MSVGISVDIYAMVGEAVYSRGNCRCNAMFGIDADSGYRHSDNQRSEKNVVPLTLC